MSSVTYINTGYLESDEKAPIYQSAWIKTGIDGSYKIITGNGDGLVQAWNSKGDDFSHAWTAKLEGYCLVSILADTNPNGGRFLIVSFASGHVYKVDVNTGKPLAQVKWPAKQAWATSLHPLGELFAACGEGDQIIIASSETETFGEKHSVIDHTNAGFSLCCEFNDSGSLLAVGHHSGRVVLYDVAKGLPVTTYLSHGAPVRCLSMVNSYLITGSDDHRIRVYDVTEVTSNPSLISNTQGESRVFSGHNGWISSLKTHNDHVLASTSLDGTIKLWDLNNLTGPINTLAANAGELWTLAWAPVGFQISRPGGRPQSALPSSLSSNATSSLSNGYFVTGGMNGITQLWRGSTA